MAALIVLIYYHCVILKTLWLKIVFAININTKYTYTSIITVTPLHHAAQCSYELVRQISTEWQHYILYQSALLFFILTSHWIHNANSTSDNHALNCACFCVQCFHCVRMYVLYKCGGFEQKKSFLNFFFVLACTNFGRKRQKWIVCVAQIWFYCMNKITWNWNDKIKRMRMIIPCANSDEFLSSSFLVCLKYFMWTNLLTINIGCIQTCAALSYMCSYVICACVEFSLIELSSFSLSLFLLHKYFIRY